MIIKLNNDNLLKVNLGFQCQISRVVMVAGDGCNCFRT